MKAAFLLTIFIFTLISCNRVTISNDRLFSLYRQRIPDSKYVMYEFDVLGYMAFEGNNQGYGILDSNQIFAKDKIDEIGADYVSGRLRIDSLQMIYLYSPRDRPISEGDTLLIPSKQYIKGYNGIPIHVAEYKYTYGVPVGWTTGGNDYVFDSLKETRDSLFFYGITKKDNYGLDLPLNKGFIKGNIKLVDSSMGWIDHIEIKEFLVRRDDVYKFGGRSIILKNRPIVDIVNYDFFPKSFMSNASVSDIGIYKRLK